MVKLQPDKKQMSNFLKHTQVVVKMVNILATQRAVVVENAKGLVN